MASDWGTESTSSTSVSPSSRAAEIVKTLLIEPGSNTSTTLML